MPDCFGRIARCSLATKRQGSKASISAWWSAASPSPEEFPTRDQILDGACAWYSFSVHAAFLVRLSVCIRDMAGAELRELPSSLRQFLMAEGFVEFFGVWPVGHSRGQDIKFAFCSPRLGKCFPDLIALDSGFCGSSP